MDAVTVYLYVLAAVLGACMGSFLNCYAWRIVHGESVWKGRSHCDACNHVLGFWDLIPVVSYVMNGGKCRYCGAKLSVLLPVSEVISGAVFVSLVMRYGVSLETAQYLLLACALLAVSFADLEAFLVPDRFLVFAVIVRLVFLALGGDFWGELVPSLIGAVTISGGVLLLVLVMEKLLKKEAMGFGDIKLLFVTGLYFGWQRNFLCLMLASFLGVLFALLPLKKGEGDEAGQFPWGPSITTAAWLTALFGAEILEW